MVFCVCAGHLESCLQPAGWKEADSSGSEASKQDEDLSSTEGRTGTQAPVQFIVGGEV